ncbi:hypothetical protein DYB35_010589 [Aphanomyces astaci]|uniref:Phosphatidylinositol-specific phospholipase C X domain-containing protein n=1 Tax=Aphanomyces astaci TaxID=112090 RepID=A0A418CW78_APHAT|nr:hypothetical protein DYB35_010589 [Aphanomyces astaci]
MKTLPWLLASIAAALGNINAIHDGSAASPREPDIDTVPAGVKCSKVRKCDDHNVCVVVCDRGTVAIAPWADRALALQRKLAYTHSLCEAQLPGTHNSAITIVDLFSLTDQLRLGARLLELDVHWVDNDLRIAHCGGFESPMLDELISWFNKVAKRLGIEIEWDSETVGCSPSLSSIPAHSQRPVQAALDEIAAWLHQPENAHEFLLIYFDDEANLLKWHKVERLLDAIKSAFPIEEILRPNDVTGPWPTFDALLAQGIRVAFLSASNYSPVGDDLLFYKQSLCSWQEPDLPFAPYPDCRFDKSPLSTLTSKGVLFRPETSEIQYGLLNAMGHLGPNVHLIDEAELPKLLECNVNIPSPDNVTPQRMEAMVWSFAPSEPTAVGPLHCTAMMRQSPRWTSRPCAATADMAIACKATENATWIVVSDSQDNACPMGFAKTVPTNGYENRLLHDALLLVAAENKPSVGVWVPVPDVVMSQVYGRGQQQGMRGEVYDSRVQSLVGSTITT